MTPLNSATATVSEYFARMAGPDKKAGIGLFAPESRVTDDGRTYSGPSEILGWLGAAASEFDYTTRVLSTEVAGDTVTVTTRLEGNFPGGVVDLRHVFTLNAAGQIATLLIAP
ncbi:nuclear transport factor 2 family protein [Cryobacterium lactosi]|uniref:Nuclear transport factor 2 family protein n=1 Tax=Cryobacterium lactosi TaxID=1259202 RepID=A0A4R9BY35_9MICO|nr:nuclear transport factor 2 family protein [Cryobacterium lactosi]TFD93359.1 nuclear transport factor 2 family protein [Cryobacterium lactosi]